MTLHQTQLTRRDRGAEVSRIFRSHKSCTRMLIFTRKRNLNITVSTERKTNADIAENPEEVRKEEEGEIGRRPWGPGLP